MYKLQKLNTGYTSHTHRKLKIRQKHEWIVWSINKVKATFLGKEKLKTTIGHQFDESSQVVEVSHTQFHTLSHNVKPNLWSINHPKAQSFSNTKIPPYPSLYPCTRTTTAQFSLDITRAHTTFTNSIQQFKFIIQSCWLNYFSKPRVYNFSLCFYILLLNRVKKIFLYIYLFYSCLRMFMLMNSMISLSPILPFKLILCTKQGLTYLTYKFDEI